MYKIIFAFTFLLFVAISSFGQNIKVAGIASKGGKNVRTSAQAQYTLMETYPLCTITVYLTGSTTLAPIFSDEVGTAKANPFTANTDASWYFYIAAGRYDIKFSGTGIISPFTLSDIFVDTGGGGGGSTVDSFESRTGAVVSQFGDYTWAEIDKTTSSLADITTRSASDLTSGTLPDARFPATLPSISGANLTNLNAANITTGTLDDNRLSSNIPRKNAANSFTQQNVFLSEVGINTSTPRRKLDVLDATGAQFRLTAVDNSVYTDFFVDSGGSLNILPTGNVAFNAAGKQINPLNNFDQNLGQINKKYLSLHAAELVVETLVAQNTVATIGGRVIIAPTNILITDLSPAATSINVKYNNLNLGDRLYMEGNSSVEFFAVTSGSSPISGGFSYSVTRNLDGTGANQWFAGDAVVNTGVSGSGFIDLYSIRGVKSSSQVGPTIVGNVRNSTTFNDWTENWVIGNLNGLCGYATDVYGACFGKYAAGIPHITVDATLGFRIYHGLSNVRAAWGTSGDLIIGTEASGQSNLFVTNAGRLSIRNNTLERIRLDTDGSGFLANNLISWDSSGNLTIQDAFFKIAGASAFFSIGTTPPTSSTIGTGIFIDRTGLYGLLSNTRQVKLDATTGAIAFAGNEATLDVNGLTLFDNDNVLKTTNAVKWKSGANTISIMQSAKTSGLNSTLRLATTSPDSTGLSSLNFQALNNSSVGPTFSIFSYGSAHGTTPSRRIAGIVDVDHGFLIATNSSTIDSLPASAALEVRSTTGAFIPPRMTSTERDALTAIDSMIIYNTTTNKLQVRAAGAWVDLH